MWKMVIKQVNTGRVWEESITMLDKNYRSKPIPKRTKREQAMLKAEEIISYFNSTLRSGESPRELIGISFVEA
ncbi:hypothetical protein [Viridibacillus arvi]|uniref:hypothetical protein n=1 Tax=Viridibacillus arvi TaxID=263475 RepID=UPI0034CEE03A